MSNGSNTHDVRTLLADAQFPAMQIDSAAVLDGGRRRVHRRRAQVIGVAVAALLVLAPSGWLVSRSVDRSGPVPAGRTGTTKPLTTGLFAKDGAVGNLGGGRVSLYPTTSRGSNDSGHPTTYQVSGSPSGLRVARVEKGTTVDLHRTGGGPSGLFQSSDGTHGIVAVRIPSDTVQVNLLTAGDDNYGTSDSVASTLTDGTSVALIETATRLTSPVDAVIWREATGTIGASTGERPAVLRQDAATIYYFSGLGALGIVGRHGAGLVRARGYVVGEGVANNGNVADFIVAGLYPRGVADVRLSPGVPGAVVRVAHLPGTRWDVVTARYRAATKAATPKIVSNFGTWDPSAGDPPRTAPAR